MKCVRANNNSTHHSDGVITPRRCQTKLLDVCVGLHGFGEVFQRGNGDVLIQTDFVIKVSTSQPFIMIRTKGDKHTLMLLRLTSVKVLSFFFILCRVSSTFVGFGGSSNTGFIFSPLITSENTQSALLSSHIHIHMFLFLCPSVFKLVFMSDFDYFTDYICPVKQTFLWIQYKLPILD